MKRFSETTIEDVERALDNVNWTEVHKDRVFSDYGDSIVIFTDGSHTIQDQSTYYRDPDTAGVLAYLKCWGYGNVDTTDYLEGWTKEELDEDDIPTSNVVIDWGYENDENGTVITERQAVERAIEEGFEDYDYWREEVEHYIEERRDTASLHSEG